jgi:hypothetical protein
MDSHGRFSGPLSCSIFLFDGFRVDVRGIADLRHGAHLDFKNIVARKIKKVRGLHPVDMAADRGSCEQPVLPLPGIGEWEDQAV